MDMLKSREDRTKTSHESFQVKEKADETVTSRRRTKASRAAAQKRQRNLCSRQAKNATSLKQLYDFCDETLSNVEGAGSEWQLRPNRTTDSTPSTSSPPNLSEASSSASLRSSSSLRVPRKARLSISHINQRRRKSKVKTFVPLRAYGADCSLAPARYMTRAAAARAAAAASTNDNISHSFWDPPHDGHVADTSIAHRNLQAVALSGVVSRGEGEKTETQQVEMQSYLLTPARRRPSLGSKRHRASLKPFSNHFNSSNATASTSSGVSFSVGTGVSTDARSSPSKCETTGRKSLGVRRVSIYRGKLVYGFTVCCKKKKKNHTRVQKCAFTNMVGMRVNLEQLFDLTYKHLPRRKAGQAKIFSAIQGA